jgi:ferritin-like metal-binding protein YciE
MALDTLADMYLEELKMLYTTEKEILKALPKMTEAARDPSLKNAFETHLRQTQGHVQRLEQIFERLGESAKGGKAPGIDGLIEEGERLIKEKPDPEVLDAGLIAAAQHVEHYEMAGYGSARAWAERLGHTEHLPLLQQTLDEEKKADELLTEIGERSVNAEVARNAGAATARSGASAFGTRRPGESRPEAR